MPVNNNIITIAAIIITYIYASIPFGVIIGKLLKGVDIRETGSGNIGTSNAFRALGPVGGGIVFLMDSLKGFLPVFLVYVLPLFENKPIIQIILGTAAIIGHNYSVFLKFKGGKGIATSFGVALGINWYIALICLALWGLIVLITRISSLASIMAAISFPVCMYLFRQPTAFFVFSILACILAIYAHRANIKRLLSGTELKMSTKEKKNVTPNK